MIKDQLKYGSKLHQKFVDAIRGRLLMSERRMKDRHSQMSQNEELYQAYIPERDVDAVRRQNREIGGVPEYRTIEIPHTYAQVLTAHTYFCSVFLSRSPTFQLAGRHGEPEMNRLSLETLLAYQLQVGQSMPPLFVWLLDPSKYGYGVIGHHWDKQIETVRQFKMMPMKLMGMPIPGTEKMQEVVEDVPSFEGNKAFNVRAQDFFPDPRVALVHFQRGEFCSRYVELSWAEIYAGSRGENAIYFNYEVLKKMRQERDTQSGGLPTRDLGSTRVTTLPNEPQQSEEAGYDIPVGFVKGHEFYIKLIPNQWGLGQGDKTEMWCFNITVNGVIFRAQPLGEYHNRFPYDVLLDEIDGYTLFPRSMVERCKPLNDVLTWLINTHFYNVRAALNNQFVADPSMVVMKDVEGPGPGKVIRLKPNAYGRDIRTMLAQLPVADVTRNHIGTDMNTMLEIIQRMTGLNDSMLGMMEQGGRKTATEVRTSTGFGINRMKTMSEWHSAVGFGPLVQAWVQRTQQFYSQAKQFRLVGDQALFGMNYQQMVTPESIAGFYDYEPVDGSLPVDRFAQANLWQMIMGQMQNYPAILAQYDIAKIFAWVAHLAGIKNMQQFKIVPDGQIAGQVQQGNVVPLAQALPAAGARPGAPAPSMRAPGMGPVA